VTEARYAALYELSSTHWWCQGMQHVTRAILEPLSNEKTLARALDAGCGAGAATTWPQDQTQSVCLDLPTQALNSSRASSMNRFIAGSVERLPFADDTFDLITMLDVLYHAGINDNEQALAEIWRVLRPDRWLLVRLPAFEWLRGPHDAAMGTQRRFTTRSAKRLLEDAGFAIQRATYANMWLFPVEAVWRLARRLLAGQHERQHDAGDLFPVPTLLNQLLAGILKTEAHLLRRMNLPCGLSVLCLARKPAEDS